MNGNIVQSLTGAVIKSLTGGDGAVGDPPAIAENETVWGAGTSGETLNFETAAGVDKDAEAAWTLAIKFRIKQQTGITILYRHANDSYVYLNSSGNLVVQAKTTTGTIIISRTETLSWGDEEVHSLVWSISSSNSELWLDGQEQFALSSLGATTTYKFPFALNGTWTSAANGDPTELNIFNVWVSDQYIDLSTHGAKFYGTNLEPTQALFDGDPIAGVTPIFAESGNAAAWNATSGISGVVSDAA